MNDQYLVVRSREYWSSQFSFSCEEKKNTSSSKSISHPIYRRNHKEANFSIMALVNSEVVAEPPMSLVVFLPSEMTSYVAWEILSA